MLRSLGELLGMLIQNRLLLRMILRLILLRDRCRWRRDILYVVLRLGIGSFCEVVVRLRPWRGGWTESLYGLLEVLRICVGSRN